VKGAKEMDRIQNVFLTKSWVKKETEAKKLNVNQKARKKPKKPL
jgi:hypothetical protein